MYNTDYKDVRHSSCYEDDEVVLERASKARRLAAYLIDKLVCFSPILIIIYNGSTPGMTRHVDIVMFMCTVLMVLKDCWGGISVGKSILGIIAREDQSGEVPLTSKLALRNMTLLMPMIEAVVLLFSSPPKRIGDMLARTRVVMNPHAKAKQQRIATLLLIIFLCVTAIIKLTAEPWRDNPAYQTCIREINTNDSLLNYTGGVKSTSLLGQPQLIPHDSSLKEMHYTFHVEGFEQDLKVYTYLYQEYDKPWRLAQIFWIPWEGD
jgi:uncharacterized RDD family membrane protein YckC